MTRWTARRCVAIACVVCALSACGFRTAPLVGDDAGAATDAGAAIDAHVETDAGPDAGRDAGPVCRDLDGDGHADAHCGGDDCDDTAPDVHPGAPEICDGIDDDCDRVVDPACVGLGATYLKSDDPERYAEFGYSVAVSGDGALVAVAPASDGSMAPGGAPWAVRLFRRTPSGFVPDGLVSPPRPSVSAGLVLALSLDGSVLAVGAENELTRAMPTAHGALHVFSRGATDWHEDAFVPSPTDAVDNFAQAIALDDAGDRVVVGAPLATSSVYRSGRAYVYERATGWTTATLLDAMPAAETNDQFGFAVGISGDGATIVAGAIFDDSRATGVGGDPTDDSVPQSGAAYVFTHGASGWAQTAYVKPSDTAFGQTFGYALALSETGDVLAIGARGDGHGGVGVDPPVVPGPDESGAVYLFERDTSGWAQTHRIKAPEPEDDAELGFHLAMTRDARTLAISSIGEDESGIGLDPAHTTRRLRRSGATFVLERRGASWAYAHYAKATNTGTFDELGWAVALSADGRTLVTGAHYEDSDARGVDGDGSNDRTEDSGAAYVFELP